eukprot:CAMPEP_0185028772 /NCGR_PEP_ID=MMETSP1103-20130426/14756_1 /TAXON_ID=36769 /ORGANISM="Paraphysomonas bandaiensis, Strain Caron Lab Isolate" /LENGTH=218 /DNA_ID=CAMNT_0027563299 /DNA_START=38 /DNA_END=694 /DNA_ORIENTATION=-
MTTVPRRNNKRKSIKLTAEESSEPNKKPTQPSPYRCGWVGSDPLMIKYHDEEWGVPSYDDRYLFEMLILEGAQAGLSWKTILNKRENYREAFDNFDIDVIAHYDAKKVEELLSNPGIVRNKLKVNATIKNAQAAQEIIKEFGSLSNYFWGFVNNTPIDNNGITHHSQIPITTPVSDTLSKDLKKRGFKFTGSTIIYAFMQAVGMTNDHEVECIQRSAK